MERVIGIDLGTTNSCVATFEGGVPKVIAIHGVYKTMPSMVAVTAAGKRLVGHLAKRQAITNAANTAYAVKRIIGRSFQHPIVERARRELPYQLTEGSNNDVNIVLQEHTYQIPEVSSFILYELKRIAEEYFGGPVEKAVITIPAYFNNGQRQATVDAGRLAGLEVIRLINEPTAAAIAYGLKKSFKKKIVVFDLGGGTFDVSILNITNGLFEVVATVGDTHLGGQDFDDRIVDWMLRSFEREHGIELRHDAMAIQRLRDAAERAKIDLSSINAAHINLPFICTHPQRGALHLQQTLTREMLEQLTTDLIYRTIDICDQLLHKEGIKRRELEDVLLVGGQTRMPKIQAAVRHYFGIEPSKSVHPDEAVALGAAIQAAVLTSSKPIEPPLLLLDVTPHNLGVVVAGGGFQTLISANTPIPARASHSFTTTRDQQTVMRIVVQQGQSAIASENELLGEFALTQLRPAKAGEVSIDVHFDISVDGILYVSAEDKETGLMQKVQMVSHGAMSDEEIQRLSAEHAVERLRFSLAAERAL